MISNYYEEAFLGFPRTGKWIITQDSHTLRDGMAYTGILKELIGGKTDDGTRVRSEGPAQGARIMSDLPAIAFRRREVQRAVRLGFKLVPMKGKVPARKDWPRPPWASQEELLALAPAHNFAVVTGPASGVIVVDVDTFGVLPGPMPNTPTVKTGGGGVHYYLKAPDPCPGNSASKIAPHIDIRGEGGCAIFPGSVHPGTQKLYVWADGLYPETVPFADCPDWLLDALKPAPVPPPPPPREGPPTDRETKYGAAALDKACQKVQEAPEGQRNHTLNAESFCIGGLVAGGVLDGPEAAQALLHAAMENGLTEHECRQTITSAFKRGGERPRGVPPPDHTPINKPSESRREQESSIPPMPINDETSERTEDLQCCSRMEPEPPEEYEPPPDNYPTVDEEAPPPEYIEECDEPSHDTKSNLDMVSGEQLRNEFSDLALAHRLADKYGERLKHAISSWYVWDRMRWREDVKAAEAYAHQLGKLLRKECSERVTDKDLAREFFKAAKRSEADATVKNVLNRLRVLRKVNADQYEWDANPYLFNCPNGTLDLRTGQMKPHTKADYITALCPTVYDPTAECSKFKRFLDEVFDGREALIEYVHWAIGYALTGLTRHQCFFILHGHGANGKSTLLNVIQKVIGPDYAHQLDAEELLAQKYARHSTEMAALRGKRFVVTNETASGRKLNESLVKGLTGGDKKRARKVCKDSFEFDPALKLFMATNHRPTIKDDSLGMWRRVRLLPFERQFDGQSRDLGLMDKLLEESRGILAWAVQAAPRVCSEAEPPLPAEVKAAIEEYKADEDVLAQFLDEACDTSWPEARTPKNDLFVRYQEYCGGRCEPKRLFLGRIKDRGFRDCTVGHKGTKAFLGLALRAKEEAAAKEGELPY